jgi:CRISPR/Cas system CSM-associated protein Csm3 (group 7 of RAMP superfamily)
VLLKFESALHHGSGYGLAGLVDRPFLRDAERMPYLSGAAIKGKFRWAALRLINSKAGGEKICGQKAGAYCRRGTACRLCRIFGSPWHSGRAFFGEAHLTEEQRAILQLVKPSDRTAGTTIRATTAIERARRVVKKDHLFTTEVAPAMTFVGSIEGALEQEDWELLRQCALVLTHFGADGSRGLGRCRYELEAGR